MEETQEDVLSGKTSLSASNLISSTAPRSTGKLIKTFVLYAAFLGLGLSSAITGPTLPYLEDKVGVGTDEISIIFTSRSVGYLTGSMVIGWLFDRFGGYHDLIFSVCMAVTGLTLAVMPWATSLTALALLCAAGGLTMSGLDTVGNAYCLRLWGSRSPPYMQALHFSFGAGAILSPLIAAPFLDQSSSAAARRIDASNTTITENLNYSSTTATFLSVSQGAEYNQTRESSSTVPSKLRRTQMFDSRIDNVQFVYLLMACYIFAVAVAYAALEVRRCMTGAVQKFAPQDDAREVLKRTDTSFLVKMLILLFIFFMLYVGLESSYGQFIATFAIKHAGFSEDDAALLTAVFWGVFTFGRGCAVLLSRHMSLPSLIMASFACCLGAQMFLCFAQNLHGAILWTFSGIVGFGFAALYPSAFTWAEGHMHISGKVAAVFVVGSSVGGMVLPASIGVLMVRAGSIYLMYAIAGFTFVCAIFFTLLCVLTGTYCSNATKRSAKVSEHIVMGRLAGSQPGDAVVAAAVQT